MRLLDINQFNPLVLIQEDGEFESLGMLSHKKNKMMVYLESRSFLSLVQSNPNISCVITNKSLCSDISNDVGIAVADDPCRAFFDFHNHLSLHTNFYWTDFDTKISEKAKIHETAYIAPKNVCIGEGAIIEPNVTILEKSIIGENVIIRAGSVIGTEGFEFRRRGNEILNVHHAGGVKLQNRVQVQANCSISRSVFEGFTELGEDTKLDNLVHVAHDVRVGKRCFLPACVMISGSVTIGDDVWIGPNASISNGVTIGDKANITIGSVVTKNVPTGKKVSGNFAVDHQKFLSFIKSIR